MSGRSQDEAGYRLGRSVRPPRFHPDHAENRWLLAAGLALVLGAAAAATFLVLSAPAAHSSPPVSVTVGPNESAAPFPVSPEVLGGEHRDQQPPRRNLHRGCGGHAGVVLPIGRAARRATGSTTPAASS